MKRSLTDPRCSHGIGNAYSDEILHAARLSPLSSRGTSSDDEIAIACATRRVRVLEEWTERLRAETGDGFPEKVTAFRPEMAVHGKYGQPCPVCGTPVQRIVYAEQRDELLPDLPDRRASCSPTGRCRGCSREDWPKTLEELEEMRADPAGTEPRGERGVRFSAAGLVLSIESQASYRRSPEDDRHVAPSDLLFARARRLRHPCSRLDSARAANTYVWTGATNSTWTVNVNWSPTRSVPASDDVLRFETGTYTVTGVPSQAIGQLVLANGAAVSLVAAIGGGTKVIQLTGGPASTWTSRRARRSACWARSRLEIWVNTGATGTIAGNVDLDNGRHRLRSADPGGLVVAAGGRVRTLSAYSGAVFGQTSLNSVVFQAGSTYEHGSGSNPFGAAAPNSVVIFQPGSLFRLMTALSPSMSGRTYANFEYNGGSRATVSGANPLTIDSITVNPARSISSSRPP